ncbi:MAG TPA: 2-oxo-4-hydroxy-4-carboxy-5-ureidoimidazoline decarboxylase [Candidatus Eisenbacteria bacterium]
MRLEALNALPEPEARAALEHCCGARAWVERVCAGRPFRSRAGLFAAAERAADKLRPSDWLEAFACHPRIGDRAALGSGAGAGDVPAAGAGPAAGAALGTTWAGEEQRGTTRAPQATLDALAEGNRAYEEKFGYIFIVCATGKSGDEMLELLRGRLANDPDTELLNAAREQRAITRLRLAKLLGESA